MITDVRAAVGEAFRRSDLSQDANERGAILEALVTDLFGLLPGLSYWRSRFLTNDGSAEFDVCFHNDVRVSLFPEAGPALVVECKNTGHRIDSGAVRIFVTKLAEIHAKWGVLVASQGITGEDERNAKAVVLDARGRGTHLLVFTRENLERLGDAAAWEAMVIDKIMGHSLKSPEF